MRNKFARVAIAVLAVFSSVTAFAGHPSTGLGQAWPNATDVSASPNWHVYVFTLGGIQYVQVNDRNGNVLGAVGTAGGQFITLPMGRFAQLVATPQQPAAVKTNAVPAATPTTVYNDGSTAMTATPMTDGSIQLRATPAQTKCDPVDCNIKAGLATPQVACDPVDCNIKASLATPQAACDPVDCNIKVNAMTSQTACDPVDCNIKVNVMTTQTICDPVDCNIKAPTVAPTRTAAPTRATTLQTMSMCDPVDCNIKAQ